MALVYSQIAIDYRLQGVVSAIDSGGSPGSLVLLADSTVISTISLARPCGTVNGGVLTFSGTLMDPSASATGNVTTAQVQNSNGDIMIYDLTVGIPLAEVDVTLVNGLNSTLITAGQAVLILAAQITGS